MKRQIRTYTFSPAGAGSGTITFTSFTTIRLDAILAVFNITRGVMIFNLADSTKGGTVATNVLTLATSTSGHSSGDALYIVYDDDDLDYDSGAGTMHRQASGLIVPGSGGPVAITGDASNGLDVDVTRVSGTVTTSAVPATSGGLSIYRFLSSATLSSNSVNVKASAGQLYGWVITNSAVAPRFVKLFDSASAPTAGSGTPKMTLQIPGNSSGSGMVAADFSTGIAFANGIGHTITGLVADADTTSIGANDVILHLFYK